MKLHVVAPEREIKVHYLTSNELDDLLKPKHKLLWILLPIMSGLAGIAAARLLLWYARSTL